MKFIAANRKTFRLPENKISSARNRCQTCHPPGWFKYKELGRWSGNPNGGSHEWMMWACGKAGKNCEKGKGFKSFCSFLFQKKNNKHFLPY
ncbi:hypothetical protein FW778_20970 [Ginsengibacter hankyongi]|uniref:Uncharacterized protein n=1 Tax=Ginsengibacter hankyongi TaxID=2607284 RepID=A0A5J5ICK1_9BACT|nr:hypothetical protein [Ginsengibacter hankyongi]KAA9035699.1 hypothetical protein FW778_20970 [Ginsengibacter hankyongi]